MDDIKNKLLLWQKLISEKKYNEVCDKFKDQVNSREWSLDRETYVAFHFIVFTNMKAYEYMKKNSTSDVNEAKEMFSLVNALCKSLEKSWNCDEFKLIVSVYTVCQYLSSMKLHDEALQITRYALKFVDSKDWHTIPEKTKKTIQSLLITFMVYIVSNEAKTNLNLIRKTVAFILSSDGLSVKIACIREISKLPGQLDFDALDIKVCDPLFVDFISSFVRKVAVSGMENPMVPCFTIICPVFEFLCAKLPASKCRILDLIELFDNFPQPLKDSYGPLLDFCGHVLRISMCHVKGSSLNEYFGTCNEALNKLMNGSSGGQCVPAVTDLAVYFASYVFTYLREWKDGYRFFASCLPELCDTLLAVFRRLKFLDVSHYFSSGGKVSNVSGEENSLPKNTFNTIYMAKFVCSTVLTPVEEINAETKMALYPRIKEIVTICLECCVEHGAGFTFERNLEIYNFIGVNFLKTSNAYRALECFNEASELSMLTLKSFSYLSVDYLSSNALKPCIEMLMHSLFKTSKTSESYLNALRAASVWSVKLPESRNTFMEYFAYLKEKILSTAEKEHLEVTCSDLLVKDKEETQSMWPKVSLENINLNELLLLELKQYASQNVCCVELVNKILKTETTPNTMLLADMYIQATRIFINSKEYLPETERYLKHIDSFIRIFQKKHDPSQSNENQHEYARILGDFHFLKFRIKLLKNRSENEAELLLLSKKPLPQNPEPGMEPDSSECYNIVHTNLTLVSEKELIADLDTAVKYWLLTIQCEKTFMERATKSVGKLNMLSFVRESALLYRLYCHKSKEHNAWEFLYILGSLLKDTSVMIYAFTNLLTLPWLVRAEWQCEIEKELPKAEKSVQTRYQLEKCNRMLNNGEFVQGNTILSSISEEDAKARIILHSRYLFVTCLYQLFGARNTTHNLELIAFQSYCKLLSWLKKSNSCNFSEICEIQHYFFEAALFLGRSPSNTYQYQRARCYLKEDINVVQKLCLPIRTCHFLIGLSNVDINLSDLQNCYVKLSALKSILRYNPDEKVKGGVESSSNTLKVVTTSAAITSTESDLRSASCESREFLGSPILENDLKFSKPECGRHGESCGCSLCAYVEFQFVCCEVLLLFSAYHYSSGKVARAQGYIRDSLDLLKSVRARLPAAEVNSKERVLELKLLANVYHIDCLASAENFAKARELCNEALNECQKSKLVNPVISTQLLDQFRSIKYVMCAKSSPKKQVSTIRKQRVKPNTFNLEKTPSSKKTVLVFEDDEDVNMKKSIIDGQITPAPSRSRRVLFNVDEDLAETPFKVPSVPAPRPSKSTNEKGKGAWSTPPDIVLNVAANAKKARQTRSNLNVEEVSQRTPSTRTKIADVKSAQTTRSKRNIENVFFENTPVGNIQSVGEKVSTRSKRNADALVLGRKVEVESTGSSENVENRRTRSRKTAAQSKEGKLDIEVTKAKSKTNSENVLMKESRLRCRKN